MSQFKEVIDGPVNDLSLRPEAPAFYPLQQLARCGLADIPIDSHRNTPDSQFFTAKDCAITSWVEGEGYKEGHALAIKVEQPRFSKNIGSFSVNAVLINVDRHKRQVEDIKSLAFTNKANKAALIETTEDIFSTHELNILHATALKILGQHIKDEASLDGNHHLKTIIAEQKPLDGRVDVALKENYIDFLSREYPAPRAA